MNGVLQTWADVDRLYVTWGKGGRGRLPVEDVVRVKKHNLSDYSKRAKVILVRVPDVFVNAKGNQN